MYLFKKLSFRGKSEVLEIKMRNWPKFSEKKKNLNTNFKIKWVKEDKINPRRTKFISNSGYVWLQKTFTRSVTRFGSQNEQLAYALNFDHGKCSYMFST